VQIIIILMEVNMQIEPGNNEIGQMRNMFSSSKPVQDKFPVLPNSSGRVSNPSLGSMFQRQVETNQKTSLVAMSVFSNMQAEQIRQAAANIRN